MAKLVVFKLGDSQFGQELPVTLQIGEAGDRPSVEATGKLPPASEILQHYKCWQSAYRNLGLQSRLTASEQQVTNVSCFEDCYNAVQQLYDSMNAWLNSESFRRLKEKLLEKLVPADQVRVILQVEDIQLQRLPWHLWDWFERYPKAELALSALTYERIEQQPLPASPKVRILAVLGNDTGIDTQADRILLEQLPNAEISFLVEPQRQEVTDQLWEQEWHILFFAGHSCTLANGKTGQITINQTEGLTISQLKYALRQAIARGLQLAIFNSCDGLGLARDLADLHIPQIIVMREPVPDQVAQAFLKYFLEAFADGTSFYLAVREARERLQGLEDQFPCASWLPVICQNPAMAPLTWSELLERNPPNSPGLLSQDSLHRLSLPSQIRGEKEDIVHTRQDWGEAVDVCVFYGRSAELATLEQWIVKDRCRLVSLLGMGGIGKTTLSVKLAEQIQAEFEYVFWRSLRNAPAVEGILTELIQFLSDQQEINLPETLEEKVSRLLNYLRQHRCLVVLDNMESMLQSGTRAGAYLPEYTGYGHLLKSVGEVQHQSCLIITSREKPKEVALLEGETLPVRSLHLRGLTQLAGEEIFVAKGCFGVSDRELQEVCEHYAGNPLALKMAASAVKELFEGNLAELMPYLRRGMLQFEDITDVLKRQFERLSPVEQQVMYWLAVNRDPVSLAELEEDVLSEAVARQLLEAVQSLGRRCLIERSQQHLLLQPVVMEYVTNRLVAGIYEEVVMSQRLELLRNYALVKAQSKDYVRQAQIRFLLRPVIDRLLNHLGSPKRIENQLREVIVRLREEAPLQPGYVGGNILNLLCELKADLKQLDFSYLTVWQAYLVGANLQHVNFAHADFSKSVFTAVLNATLAVGFSPDGKLLAMGNADNKVRIWQVADYRERLTCEGHTSWVCSVAFSPDSQILASSSFDQTIKLWDLSTGECLKTLSGHTGWVWSVTFSLDGQTLASGGDDQVIRLWDIHTGECLKTLQGHTGTIRAVAFGPDGQTLATGGHDQTLRLWDVKSGQSVKILSGHTNWVRAVTFSSEGQTLISGSDDCTLRLWDVSTGQCLKILQGHAHSATSVAYAPSTGDYTNSSDGQTLASGSQDSTVRLWNISTGQCLRILQGHPNGIWSIAFHPDGQTLASSSNDSSVKLWNTKTGESLRTLQGYSSGIKTAAFSSDGQVLASGGDDKTIQLWNVQSGECCRTLQGHSGWIWCIVFSQDSQTLASSSSDGTIRLWDVSTGQMLRSLQGHKNLVFSVAFSPDDRILASSSSDQTARLWNVQTGECLKTLSHQGQVWSVAFSPDGQILASASDDKTIKLWDVRSGECCQTLQGHTGLVLSVAFSPDGQILASGSNDKTVKLWDVRSGECCKTLEDHIGPIWSVAFDLLDEQILASSSFDQTVRLWHIQSGRCLKILQGHIGEVWATAFSPHSPVLVTGGQDGTIKLWDVATGKCLKTLRNKRPYEQMNITKVSGLTEAQKESLKVLGAVELE